MINAKVRETTEWGTRDLFVYQILRELSHGVIRSNKDRNGMDQTERKEDKEEMKNTQKLYKKDLQEFRLSMMEDHHLELETSGVVKSCTLEDHYKQSY